MSALNEHIRKFYNNSTPLWLNTWGEHMHHGFYGIDGKTKKDDHQAQIDLIHELLNWSKIQKPLTILDAGCGVGGSSRYLSKYYNAQVTGLTLSNVQAEYAQILNKKAGINSVNIIVKDMMTLAKSDGSYDLIWSLESAEHIENKKKLLETFYDLMKPDGKLIMATWCIRDSPPELNKKELALAGKISKLYFLPPMISMNDYDTIIKNTGFKNVCAADWSLAVAPFWDAVIRSALKWKNVNGLISAGMSTIKGAWAMRYMKKGFHDGTIKFAVFQGQKK